MTFSKKWLSSVLAVCMLLTCLSPIPAKAVGGSEREVTTEAELMNALKDSSVSKIILTQKFDIHRPGEDEIFVIPEHDKTLVITARPDVDLSLSHAGIILGGDTTFENMTLTLTNPVRNAIIANGHTLTLDNVVRDNNSMYSGWRTHLFCGGITDYYDHEKLPQSGNHGQVILRGKSEVGDVFAGSLSDVGKDAKNSPNEFRHPATIDAGLSASGQIGTIYGCGARENRSGSDGDGWFAEAENYTVSRDVTIKLNGSKVRNIDGNTGTDTAAKVIYRDSNRYRNESLKLKNISGLDVQLGNLIPISGSTFFRKDASVKISDKAQLNLKNMNDMLSAGDLTGGGMLILGEGQQILFDGQVSGTTKVAIKDVQNGGKNSSGIPEEDFIYISAPKSQDDAFTLLPYPQAPDMQLIRNEQGYWAVKKKESAGNQKLLMESISIPATFTADDDTQALIPVTVEYATDSLEALELLPFRAGETGAGKDVQAQPDSDGAYSCTISLDAASLALMFGTFDTGSALLITNNSAQTLPAGLYHLSITIPKQYIRDSNQDTVLSTVLTIPDKTQPEPDTLEKIPRPTAITGLKYTGQEQSGVADGKGYTLSGHKGTQRGEYHATAVLTKGYQWDDGSMADADISWQIAPAPLTITGATLESKTYDGTAAAQVQNVTLSGTMNGETLQFNKDYTASAKFNDPNAGKNKTADVTVTLKDGARNYTLENNVFKLTGQEIQLREGASAPDVSGSYEVSEKNPNTFVYTVHPIPGAEYRMDSGEWQDANTFDGIAPKSTHTFSARIKGNSNQADGAEGKTDAVFFQKLQHPHIPSLKTTLSGTNGNRTIEIEPVEGAEYSFDGGASYSDNHSKSGCTGTVKVAIRYKETAVYHASQPATQDVDTSKQTQAALTIGAVGDKTYGDAAFTLTASGGSGEGTISFTSSKSDVLRIDGSTAEILQAGKVDIIATKAEDSNYNAVSATLSLEIGKKALTVKAKDQSVSVGGKMPELTVQVDGLVREDTFTAPVLTTMAKDTNLPGEFDIMVSGGTLTHEESYTITYEKGKLTISDQSYALTVNHGKSKSASYRAGETVTITADSRNGYTFEWTSDSGIVFADSKAQTTTFQMPGKAVVVTANYKAVDTDNGSSGGSSSGGSSSGGSSSGGSSSGGSSSGGSSSGGSSSGSSSSSSGKVEVAKHPDGSRTETEKQKDGTVIAREISKAGDRTETVTKKDGSSLFHTKQKNGTAAIVAVAPSGQINAQVRFSEKNIEEEGGRPLVLPIPKVTITHDEMQAPNIQVQTEKAQDIKVKIPVDTKNPGVVAVLVDANGKRQVLQKSLIQDDGLTVALKTPATIQLIDNTKLFEDVPPTHWAKDSITFVTARGIYGGASGETFEPETNMTRGMLVKVLHNLENHPKASGTKTFSDIKPNAWYAEAVQWATEKGIVSGAEQNTFEPNQTITREQLAVILYRYMQQPASSGQTLPFQDADAVSGYAQDALTWAVEQGIIQGEDGNILNPKGALNRAECAAMLMRCLQTQAK